MGAILARPDDDEPRLVYADALLSRGDPRGELIGVQCELARLGTVDGVCIGDDLFHDWIGDELMDVQLLGSGRIGELRRREGELLRLHGAAWAQPISASAVTKEAVHFRRGFVERVGWNAAGSSVASIFAMAPFVRSLQFVSYAPATPREDYFRSPHTARLRELHMIGDPLVVPFVASREELRNLERLLHSHPGGPHQLATLASASFLPGLRQLVLDGVRLAEGEVEGFLSVPDQLLELQCIGGALGPKGAAALLSTSSTRALRVLSLRHQRLGPGGVAGLVGAPSHATLLAIDLRTNQLGPADVRALAGTLDRARVLELSNNPLGDDAMLAFHTEPGLAALSVLGLQQTRLGDEGLRLLLESPLAARLRVLDLRKNLLTDEAARLLAHSGALRSIATLYLGGNRIGAAGKKLLRASTQLEQARIFL